MSTEAAPAYNELVSTSTITSRNSKQRYTTVVFAERVSSVKFRVHNSKSSEPGVNPFHSGSLDTKFVDETHAFLFPVTKGMIYFIEVEMEVEAGWGEPVKLSWTMDPFKRRSATREELTPAPVASAPSSKRKKSD
jgi:hypothetical protein